MHQTADSPQIACTEFADVSPHSQPLLSDDHGRTLRLHESVRVPFFLMHSLVKTEVGLVQISQSSLCERFDAPYDRVLCAANGVANHSGMHVDMLIIDRAVAFRFSENMNVDVQHGAYRRDGSLYLMHDK